MGIAFRYVIIGGGVAAGYADLEFTKKGSHYINLSLPIFCKAFLYTVKCNSVHPNPDVYNFVVDWPSASRGESKVKRSMQGMISRLMFVFVDCFAQFFEVLN
uniref:Uncharacterized protein n=1 Tax=Lactuca sativa TaxID=4236 RepID=A0A9R1WGL3_LACSA|nr:hypothetical protein LSAT_V11C100045210 [Lactuca sativa]